MTIISYSTMKPDNLCTASSKPMRVARTDAQVTRDQERLTNNQAAPGCRVLGGALIAQLKETT